MSATIAFRSVRKTAVELVGPSAGSTSFEVKGYRWADATGYGPTTVHLSYYSDEAVARAAYESLVVEG